MEFVLDDASNEVVQMLKAINVEEEAAIAWYWRVIGNNKEFFLIIGFLLLFSLFFYPIAFSLDSPLYSSNTSLQ